MSYKYSKPIITDRSIQVALEILVKQHPEEASQSDAEEVLLIVGKLVTGGYQVPEMLEKWVAAIPIGVILLARVAMQTTTANAHFRHQKDIERAIFGLVGYAWLFEPHPVCRLSFQPSQL